MQMLTSVPAMMNSVHQGIEKEVTKKVRQILVRGKEHPTEVIMFGNKENVTK